MARITVEDCLDHESNRFALVRLASHRAKQLLSGSAPVTNTRGNRAIVSALREIADGKVRYKKRDPSALDASPLSYEEAEEAVDTGTDLEPEGE